MYKALIAAFAGIVCQIAFDSALAFGPLDALPARTADSRGTVDRKILAARGAKAAAYALINKGIPLLEAGQCEAASELFSRAIAEHPKLGKAYRFRGLALDYRGKLDEALDDLNHAVELEPNEPDNYYIRGCVLAEKHEYGHAVADFDLYIDAVPNVAVVHRQRGHCWFRLGEFSKAIADFNDAVRLNPALSRAYSNRGELFATQGDYARAISDLTRAIELDRDDIWPLDARAALHYLQGNYDKCIEDCNEAIRLNPKDSCAYQNRGAALGMKDRFDDSITDSTRAIELASTARAWPFINRAMARAGKGNYESAIRDLESALDVEPNNQYANVWLAYHLAACLDEHSRDAKRAKNTAITACELSNWNDTPSLDVLGMAYAEASEFEKAIEYAEKALSIAATFQNSASLQQQLRRRIELYRNGRAYHGNVRKWAIEYAGLADDLGRIYRPQNFSNSD